MFVQIPQKEIKVVLQAFCTVSRRIKRGHGITGGTIILALGRTPGKSLKNLYFVFEHFRKFGRWGTPAVVRILVPPLARRHLLCNPGTRVCFSGCVPMTIGNVRSRTLVDDPANITPSCPNRNTQHVLTKVLSSQIKSSQVYCTTKDAKASNMLHT